MIRKAIIIFMVVAGAANAAEPAVRSHPAMRRGQEPSARPADQGPAFFVDPLRGDDRGLGNAGAPWRTLRHAIEQLRPGDTLYLKGGVYYDSLYIARTGKPDAVITIRSAPGELAILDGGWREFMDKPADAWEPFAGGGPDEYRSKRRFPNVRDVIGCFGDSMIGLQTYYHAQDLQATNERIDWQDWKRTSETDLKPLYCGPGLWFNAATGHIHCRLAHTNLPAPLVNYRGETDPRRIPMVLAPFHASVLHLDQAKHFRLQDLELRGGGYATVRLDQCTDVTFDNVTIWCGSYGLRVSGTQGLRIYNCGLYGSVPPWTFRGDTSKRDYPGRPHRNITRLSTHALLEIDNGRESSVYATPQNDRWEIAQCDLGDAHDGVYLGAINVDFHHNLLENLQDDGVYLSPMYFRHRLDKSDPKLLIHENLFRGMLTALAFGGTEPETRDRVFVYRNVVDLRRPVLTGRPSTQRVEAGTSTGKVIGDHGSPPWSAMNVYHNTFVMAEGARDAGMGMITSTRAGHPRRIFNNVFLHLARLPAYSGPDPAQNAVEDGNLFWSPSADAKATANFFAKYRAGKLFADSKALYPPGSSSSSRVADPGFVNNEFFHPTKDSLAVNAGVPIPADWPDLRTGGDVDKPDVGAIPLNAKTPVYGRIRGGRAP